MKKVFRAFVLLVALLAVTSFAYAKDPPGKADNFYRGITTLAPVVTSELVSSSSVVLSSESVASDPVVTVVTSDPVVVETRVIGNGQGNNGKDRYHQGDHERNSGHNHFCCRDYECVRSDDHCRFAPWRADKQRQAA